MAPIAIHDHANGAGHGESAKPSKAKISTKEVMELEDKYSAYVQSDR
jgi:hypothetical protein